MGMKFSIVRQTSFTSFRKSRIVSSMSSRSSWNSFCRSWISCCVCLCLCQSFSSLEVIFWTLSCEESYFSSKFSLSCSAFSSSSFILCSSRFLSSPSICTLLSSCSCCMAFSMTCVPTSIFSSMALSFCTIWACAASSSSCWRLLSSSSSRSFCFSSTAMFSCEMMAAFSAAIAASCCARSSSRLSWMAAMSASVIPVLTTFCFSTTFSTIFSFSTISFCTMTSCSCGSCGCFGCLGCFGLA
mmetsp:Transcript_52216/g.148860  ORF Transcript_52216/g.148860 Transcript_52216/m.148860 type:complete len:242 (+) Transcript_52216:561-1286(+)